MYLFFIQMPGNSFKFDIQAISHVAYNLNSRLLVRYSSHDLNKNPFNDQTGLDHWNTKLV